MKPSCSEPAAPQPRVGIVVKMFPRLSETFILNEVLELEAQGLDLNVFSLRQPVDTVRHAAAGRVRSPVRYLPTRFRMAPLRMAAAQMHVWHRQPKAWQHACRNLLRRSRADGESGVWLPFLQACCIVREAGGLSHLHAHYANVPAKVALLVHRLSGASYSVTTHAKDIFQNDPFSSPKLQERLSRASFVVANSRFSARHIAQCLGRQEGIHTIYNGLDLEAFHVRAAAPTEPIILSVGRLVEKKGFGVLLTACRALKQRALNFRCELVGTGPLSSALKEQIRSLGLGDRVRLCGPLPQQEVREKYARAAVFALPCVAAADGDRDVLPNVVKEAMAVGVPVVTSRMDGIEELITDGISGLLVEPGDSSGLAAHLERLLRQPELGRELAIAGRSVIEERFDRRTNIARLKRLLSQAISPEAAALSEPAAIPVNAYENCLR